MNNMAHRRVYNLMKLEASEGRRRIIATMNARKHHTNQTSYTTAQIDEVTMDAEVLRIYRDAQPQTRALYDLAQDTVNPDRPNWIIRWMLWHVFRYRDGRQNTASNHQPDGRARSSSIEDTGRGSGHSGRTAAGFSTMPGNHGE
jgi:hypothetical protein